jgi:hypothetical protein
MGRRALDLNPTRQITIDDYHVRLCRKRGAHWLPSCEPFQDGARVNAEPGTIKSADASGGKRRSVQSPGWTSQT